MNPRPMTPRATTMVWSDSEMVPAATARRVTVVDDTGATAALLFRLKDDSRLELFVAATNFDLQSHGTQVDHVSVLQRRLPDAARVDSDAVAAAQVADEPAAGFPDNERMAARHAFVLENEVAVVGATEQCTVALHGE